MARSWHERGQYANMIKDVLSTQMQCYKKEHDNLKKTKIAQSIGYLGQIVNSLISAQEEVSFQSKISDISDVTITEDMIKEFVRFTLKNNKGNEILGKNELLQNITKFKKCDLNYLNSFFAKMEDLGLNVCKKMYDYDLEKFAIIRHYIEDKSDKNTKERM